MDIALLETGNGGDCQIVGNDLAMQGSWGNMVYLAMFGGNKGYVTKARVPNQEVKDWWGNGLLFTNDSSLQFNSLTEWTLENVALSSEGRLQIESAVKQDLEFMKAFSELTISVTLYDVDKVKIFIRVDKKENVSTIYSDQLNELIFIWDATNKIIGDFSILDFDPEDFYI